MKIREELVLPNGLTLPNRLAKSATSEALAGPDGLPSEALERLYARWGGGGAGLLITGNVVVDPEGRTEPGNVMLMGREALPGLRRWAEAAQRDGAKLFLQINHAGRQVSRRISHRPVAPSAVRLKKGGVLFATPSALTDAEIRELVRRYVFAAELAAEAGFAGVQIHAAHGYLASQFLSPLTNQRDDAWGGDATRRMRFLLEIVRATRAAVGDRLAIAVKLNSADFQRGGFTEEESLDVVEALDREGIDLLEISGGSYERSAMMGSEKKSTQAREAYFLDFADRVRERTRVPLMVTGGFRSAGAMEEALTSGSVDVIGMARPLIVEPDLPARLLAGRSTSALSVTPRVGIGLFDDMLQIVWFQRQLRRMGAGQPPLPDLGRWSSLVVGFARSYAFNPLTMLRRPVGLRLPADVDPVGSAS
ncbi:MAG: NADH:flavin oxidoreductase/NADH oxidase family protein [Sandaracinaceae bacterium]|nr:NADH:flavin oxidoreductase/NADH oxidase family protein [Sandaracinaceae bacterium]